MFLLPLGLVASTSRCPACSQRRLRPCKH